MSSASIQTTSAPQTLITPSVSSLFTWCSSSPRLPSTPSGVSCHFKHTSVSTCLHLLQKTWRQHQPQASKCPSNNCLSSYCLSLTSSGLSRSSSPTQWLQTLSLLEMSGLTLKMLPPQPRSWPKIWLEHQLKPLRLECASIQTSPAPRTDTNNIHCVCQSEKMQLQPQPPINTFRAELSFQPTKSLHLSFLK